MALHPAHVPGLLLAGDGQLLRQPLHLLLDEQEVYYDSSTTGWTRGIHTMTHLLLDEQEVYNDSSTVLLDEQEVYHDTSTTGSTGWTRGILWLI